MAPHSFLRISVLQNPVFENCRCVQANLDAMSNFTLDDEELVGMDTAQVGVCENDCYGLGIFLAVSVVAFFLIFILLVPNITITIR